jgi:very-short-patch-repair endonuclease
MRRLHTGVYAVGPIESPQARVMAAVLACSGGRGAAQDGALVSHRTAAGLWRLSPPPAEREPVELLVPGLARGRRPGIRTHRTGPLAADERTELDGVPITTPARTVLDLAAGLGARELERLVAHVEREALAGREQLEALALRRCRHRGAALLGRVLALQDGPQLTRSEAESRFLELVRRAGLPPPAANARVQGCEVDFLWRSERLVVEVDGFAFHSTPAAFERDRGRDAKLTAAGFRVLRLTWRQIDAAPETTLVAVARALSVTAAPSGGLRERPLLR